MEVTKAYVIYFPAVKEYLAGSARASRFDRRLGKARIFQNIGWAKNSVTENHLKWKKEKRTNPVIIPVTISLDPKDAFSVLLKGSDVTED